jgi:hypothetical protein
MPHVEAAHVALPDNVGTFRIAAQRSTTASRAALKPASPQIPDNSVAARARVRAEACRTPVAVQFFILDRSPRPDARLRGAQAYRAPVTGQFVARLLLSLHASRAVEAAYRADTGQCWDVADRRSALQDRFKGRRSFVSELFPDNS